MAQRGMEMSSTTSTSTADAAAAAAAAANMPDQGADLEAQAQSSTSSDGGSSSKLKLLSSSSSSDPHQHHPEEAEAKGKDDELYSDSRSLGWEAAAGIVVGVALVFVLEMGFSVLMTFIMHGVHGISQVCECPANAADFGPSSVFYKGCVNTTSAWFKTHNAVAANKSLSVTGWFGETTYSRESYYSQQFTVKPAASSIPNLYKCPIYRPIWDSPVDIVGIILFAVGMISVGMSVIDAVIVKTSVYEDRVEVKYYFGKRAAMPLHAMIADDQGNLATKHELASGPFFPIRDYALVLKATELVTFEEGEYGTAVSTRLKDKDISWSSAKALRVEPARVDEFKAALAKAHESQAQTGKSPSHMFEHEIPYETSMTSSSSAGAGGWENEPSPSRVGYWIRSTYILIIWFLVMFLGVKIGIEAVKELVQPGRPKPPDHWGRMLVDLGIEAIIIGCFVLYGGFCEFFDSVPTKVILNDNAFFAFFERSKNSGLEKFTHKLIIPRTALLPVDSSDVDACEKCLTAIFNEVGSIELKAEHYFIIKDDEKEKKVVVTKKYKKLTKAQKESGKRLGRIPEVVQWRYLMVSDEVKKGKFLAEVNKSQ